MREQQDLFGKSVPKIVLHVTGKIPSFKNNKMLITKGPGGRPLPRPMLITKPELQQRMKEITESFVLQLLASFQTDTGKTLTGCALQSSIALSLPEDDCWTRVPEVHLKAVLTPGSEGAIVTIEKL